MEIPERISLIWNSLCAWSLRILGKSHTLLRLQTSSRRTSSSQRKVKLSSVTLAWAGSSARRQQMPTHSVSQLRLKNKNDVSIERCPLFSQSARRTTCRRSAFTKTDTTSSRTCGRWAACCTKWPHYSHHSTATRWICTRCARKSSGVNIRRCLPISTRKR